MLYLNRIILVLSLVFVCSAAVVAAGRPPPPVVTAVVQQQMLAPQAWVAGSLISRNDARLAAEVKGRLEWVADVGMRVAAQAEVARMDDAQMKQELLEHTAAVSREQARLVFSKREVKRLKKLALKNNAAQSRLDQSTSELGVTRSNLQAAKARAALTQDQLARMVLRAPFDGVVTERYVKTGEWADVGEAVVRVVDTGSLEIQVRVPPATLRFIQPGDVLTISSDAGSATAMVRTIVPVGDDRSRLFELRLDPQEVNWPAGQTIRVAVPTGSARDVIAIPRDALVLRRSGTSVYRIGKDNTAERVQVTTGVASGNLIEVSGAISPGDRVVVRGGERLRPGQKVNILPAGK